MATLRAASEATSLLDHVQNDKAWPSGIGGRRRALMIRRADALPRRIIVKLKNGLPETFSALTASFAKGVFSSERIRGRFPFKQDESGGDDVVLEGLSYTDTHLGRRPRSTAARAGGLSYQRAAKQLGLLWRCRNLPTSNALVCRRTYCISAAIRRHHAYLEDPGTRSTERDRTSDRVVNAAEETDKQAQSDQHELGKLDNAEFVKKAGAAGAAEVEMGKIGAQRATNAEVKAFAQRMVTDHTKANKELTVAASAKGLEVPSSPGLAHKAMKEKFERQAADKDFDHDFMQQMVRDHKAAVELFETAANEPDLDPDLRTLAKKTLPTLRDHLKSAQAIEGKFKE